MTIGWGAACADGVVLMADSMYVRYARDPDGRLTDVWPERINKLHWIEDLVAFVFAGSFDGGADCAARLDGDLPDLDDVARQLFRSVLARRGVGASTMQITAESEPSGAQMLVGGGPPDQVPQLRLIRHHGSDEGLEVPVETIPTGSAFGIGLMWWDPTGGPPGDRGHRGTIRHISDELTVDAALGLGIRACRDYVRSIYRSAGGDRLGDFPGSLTCAPGQRIVPVAFPLRVAVITAERADEYEVALVDDVTPEDLERAKELRAAARPAEPPVAAGAEPGA